MFRKRFVSTIVAVAMLTLLFGSQAIGADKKNPTSGEVDLTNSDVSALSVNIGGGVWDYGTYSSGINQKTVYSNYLHTTSKHHASCSIGTNFSSSGVVDPKVTAYSSAVGSWGDVTHAYWGLD